MRNNDYLLNLIKQASLDAVNAQVPMQITYGTVVSESPLSVNIDSKLTLQEIHLEVVKSLSDYEVDIEFSGATQTVIIKNSLKNGDKVAMIRFPGGKRYLVVDRV